jgi:release factor glutamine methyltransferase
MTIADAVFAAVDRLEHAGCDSPRLDAELLMAHSLHLTRTQLYAHCHQVMSTAQEDLFEALVDRRAAREPLAYIVGHKEFYGLDFAVDPRVLIPRPETEHLVEAALTEATTIDPTGAVRIADIGAGSGAIAVSLAVKLPAAQVVAADVSADALAVALENVQRHRVADRVRLVESDLLTAVAGPLDLIVANLPYISRDEWTTLAPEIAQFEPPTALDGGPDGLDSIRRLILQVAQCAAESGPLTNISKDADTSETYSKSASRLPRALLLEIGSTQGEAVTSLARAAFPSAEVFIVQDYAGLDRVVGIRL